MKYRSDFVTNSSSSSFIISFKDDVSLDAKIKEQNPVLEHMENIVKKYFMEGTRTYNDDAATVFYNVDYEDEVRYWIRERYGRYDESFYDIIERDEFAKNTYDKIMSELKAGNKVAVKNITYDDNDMSEILYLLAAEKKLKIISTKEN